MASPAAPPRPADVPVAALGWHALWDLVAYAAGFQLFLALRRRQPHPTRAPEGLWVFVGAIAGAALGAKLLDLAQFAAHVELGTLRSWGSGKTVVGGLLGGWIGVEIAKRRVGIRGSTGDLMVLPLGLGIALGRVGCLFAGPADHTWGLPVAGGWDAGDGLPRHPAPLYEALFVLPLAAALHRRTLPDGHRFRWFMAAYLLFRLGIDFLKPPFGPDPGLPAPIRLGPLTPIQWAAAVGATVATGLNLRRRAT